MITISLNLSRPSRITCSSRLYARVQLSTSYISHKGPVQRWISDATTPRAVSNHASASSISHPTYKPIEDIEPFERYTAGGYYPVRLGDHFHSSRYRVVHKLGHGASSTIWLARDKLLAKYIAIKIAVSGLNRPLDSVVLKMLWDSEKITGKSHVCNSLIPEILDEFEVEGPEIHGVRQTHHCIVTTLARMSLSEARGASSSRLFQPLVAHAIAAQLVQAVAFMHSCGIVHGGMYLIERIPRQLSNLLTMLRSS